MTTRTDANLAAHVATCRDPECPFCEGIAEELANPPRPSGRDEAHGASVAEDRETRWREGVA